MVFCYKTITETPRRRSPRKEARLSTWPSSITYQMGTGDIDDCTDLGSIPEREWRLLAALARKREEEDEREKLADQFRRMWQKEKEEREMAEAETSDQYKRYIHEKREQDRSWLEHRRLLRNLDQQYRRGQLLDTIRHKERRSEELRAWNGDKKTTELIDKVLEDEARSLLAAERRSRIEAAADWRKQVEVEATRRRVDDADRRRSSFLRDASRRVAISNALNTWECSLLRKEQEASEAAKRAQWSALASLAAARGARVTRARDLRRRRARAMAARTERLRDAVKSGRISN